MGTFFPISPKNKRLLLHKVEVEKNPTNTIVLGELEKEKGGGKNNINPLPLGWAAKCMQVLESLP